MQEGVDHPGSVGASLDRFLDDLTIAGYSPLTVKHYRWKLRKRLPLDWPLCELTTALLRSLVAAEVRYAKPGTAAAFDTMLRSFSKWLWKQQLTAVNLMAGVPSPKPEEPQKRALSAEALARLWQAACELDSEAARAALQNPAEAVDLISYSGRQQQSTSYRLLFAMLRDTGLRRAEVAGARYEDIEGDVLRVLGKGRKYRRVLLSESVLGLLALPLIPETKWESKWERRGPIFGLSPSRIGRLFADIARRAGVKATAHSMRHTWASRFLVDGGDAFHLQTLGGWSSGAMIRRRYGRSVVEDAALAEARRVSNSPRIGP